MKLRRRLLSMAEGGIVGLGTSIGASLLASSGHWVWALILLAAVVVAVVLFALWDMSDAHLYAVYERQRKRELRRNRG